MSIIQEALKKAQVDYGVRAILSKTAARNKARRARKARRSMTIWLIFILSMIIMSALTLRIFFIFEHRGVIERNLAGPLMSKEGRFAPFADMAAPASFGKPVEPPNPASPPPEPSSVPTFVLNGIMHLDNKPQAIINGYILEEGDAINGATVMLIDKDYVLLNLKDDKIKVKLKD